MSLPVSHSSVSVHVPCMYGYPFLLTSPTDVVDEYWCDTANRTLPRDLISSTVVTPGDIDHIMDDPTDSAGFFFIQPALLVSHQGVGRLSM